MLEVMHETCNVKYFVYTKVNIHSHRPGAGNAPKVTKEHQKALLPNNTGNGHERVDC